jgi:hypothetical protein
MILRTGIHGISGHGVIPVTQMVSGAMGIPLWWDPNGENLPVVAAYRAIATAGSPWSLAPANYAESLQNWSNPGVNDLVEGNGAVPWAANTGWQFVAAATQYFDTGLIPANDQSWSMLAQFSNGILAPLNYLVGAYSSVANTFFGVVYQSGANRVAYLNGGPTYVIPTLAAGNVGLAGSQGFRNGVAEGAPIAAWGGASTRSAYIGARNNGGVADLFTTANAGSVVFYSGTLTAPQMLAVATAMAAL